MGTTGMALPRAPLPPASAPGELDWQDQARCRETDPELFFPEKGQPSTAAKRVCMSCDVRTECLEYALRNGERYGVFGGKTERERRRIAKDRRKADAAEVAA